MDNYKKGNQVMNREKIPIRNLPENFVWMHVSAGSKMKNLLEFAMKALGEKKGVLWTGTGFPSFRKTISCVEILKRKYNAFQISKICYNDVECDWDRLFKQEPYNAIRDITTIHIFISTEELDENEPGYQAPGKCDAFWNSDQTSGKLRSDNTRQVKKTQAC